MRIFTFIRGMTILKMEVRIEYGDELIMVYKYPHLFSITTINYFSFQTEITDIKVAEKIISFL